MISFSFLGQRSVRPLTLVVAFSVAAFFAAFANIHAAHAATVTIAQGQVTNGSGVGVEDVRIEFHNGNGSISTSTTTDGSGNYTLTADDAQANGQQMTVEIGGTLPDGYVKPTNSPTLFAYTIGDAIRTINFALIPAPKTINIVLETTDGQSVQYGDISATPADAETRIAANGTVSNGSGSVDVPGGKWIVKVDRNLSEQDPTRYPWVAIGGAQEVEFTQDGSTESATLTFTVVSSNTLVKIKPTDKNGAILTQNSFDGDVSFVGYTEHGAVSTQAKVNGTTGIAQLYLLPGIYTVDAYHQQLSGQSFNPNSNTFVVEDTAGTYDWGTLQAEADTGKLKGAVSLLNYDSKGKESAKTAAPSNIRITATNLSSGRTYTATTTSGGKFEIQNVGAGEYAIDMDNEVTQYISIQSASAIIETGKTVDDLDVVLTAKDVTINGTVKDQSGNAIENLPATVVVKVGSEEFSAPVESDGTFSVPVFRNADKTVDLRLVTQKGAEYFADNTTVSIASGSTVTKNITAKSSEGTINGNIADFANDQNVGEGVTGEGVTITAINTSTGSVEEATADANGAFSMEVGPGKWKLLPKIGDVDASAVVGGVAKDTVTVSENGTVSNVKVGVHVNDGGSVTGVVKDKNGAAVAEARVVITNLPALEIAADKAKRDINSEKVISTVAKTDANGSFTESLPDGKYTAYFSEHPEIDNQVTPKGRSFTVSGGVINLGENRFGGANHRMKGSLDKDLTQAYVTFYSESGKTVQADVNGSRYTADVNNGKWTVVVSGVDKDGELSMMTRDVEVKGDRTYNFNSVPSTGIDFPAAAQKSCEADEVCTVGNKDGAQMRLAPYAAAAEGNIVAQVAPVPEVQFANGVAQVGIAYEMTVWNDDGIEVSQLSRPADIKLPIEKKLLANGVDTSELTPSFYNPELGQFLPDGLVSTNSTSSMTLQTDHLTRFAVTTANDKVKPGKARSLSSKKMKSTSAELNWAFPTGATVKDYTVEIRKAGKKKAFKTVKRVKTEKKLITKLSKNTRYQFRVKACNMEGCGKFTNWKTFQTKK